MMRITNFRETPPGGYKYLVPELSRWVPDPAVHGSSSFFTFEDLEAAVRAIYKANSIPPPADLTAQMMDQICHSIPGHFCEDEYGRRRRGSSWQFNVQAVVQGTLTLGRWLGQGLPTVDQAEIIRRSSICASCPFNQQPEGCTSCNAASLLNALGPFVTGSPLPSDGALKSCRICSCALRLKVRLPLDTLLKHIPAEQLSELPSNCWLK